MASDASWQHIFAPPDVFPKPPCVNTHPCANTTLCQHHLVSTPPCVNTHLVSAHTLCQHTPCVNTHLVSTHTLCQHTPCANTTLCQHHLVPTPPCASVRLSRCGGSVCADSNHGYEIDMGINMSTDICYPPLQSTQQKAVFYTTRCVCTCIPCGSMRHHTTGRIYAPLVIPRGSMRHRPKLNPGPKEKNKRCIDGMMWCPWVDRCIDGMMWCPWVGACSKASECQYTSKEDVGSTHRRGICGRSVVWPIAL